MPLQLVPSESLSAMIGRKSGQRTGLDRFDFHPHPADKHSHQQLNRVPV
jgi:hypothetical protein